jgi:hypothetical protein
VAGEKKGGVGLDDPELTMLVLCSDTTDVRQYEGRLRTVNNLIYHVVDNYKPFEKHWDLCEEWYLERGAEIIIENTANRVINVSSKPQRRRLTPANVLNVIQTRKI